MRHGARKNYKQSQKNHWRRTVWNEVLRRTAGREQQESILYLAGPNDLDRAIATDKGVPDGNLVAIDRDATNHRAIRRQERLAIRADALDLLWSWPKTKPVCAVLLDFCSGICQDNLGAFDAFQREGLRCAVVMMNFQRGRDPIAVELSKLFEAMDLLHPLWRFETTGGDLANGPQVADPVPVVTDVRHRGYLYLLYHAVDAVQSSVGLGSYGANLEVGLEAAATGSRQARCAIPPRGSEAAEMLTLLYGAFIKSTEPRFYSYRSGALVFDSVVFQHPERHLHDPARAPVLARLGFDADQRQEHDALVQRMESAFKVKKVLHRVGAAFAAATARARRAVQA